MDVTCERCGTEYEFDDALVSERGTTVKCSSCSHQFRIRRHTGPALPERWVVRTVDGRELEFTALRELQAAISNKVVTRDDVLSRDGGRPRRLGSIPELEPFFMNATMSVSVPAPSPSREPPPAHRGQATVPTGMGSYGGRTDGSVAIPLPIAVDRSSVAYGEPVNVGQRRSSSMPPPLPSPFRTSPSAQPPPNPGRTSGTIRAAAPVAPAHDLTNLEQPALPPPPRTPAITIAARPMSEPPPPAKATVRFAEPIPAPMTERAVNRETLRSVPPMTQPMGGAPISQAPMSPGPSSAARSVPPLTSMTPTPGEVRLSIDESSAELRYSTVNSSKRQGSARLIVGIVVAGLLVFAGIAVGKKYLDGSSAPETTAPVVDDRATTLRQQANVAIDQGDLDTAQETLVKASALAEKDVAIHLDLARVAAAKGDFAWLRLRLRAEDDPERASLTQDASRAAERAKKAADKAMELAPSEPRALLARVHALALSGQREEARRLVPTMIGVSTEQSGVVLALLDLDEKNPDWPVVVERLRGAVVQEKGLGRARALLIFALARAGSVSEAKNEMRDLDGAKPHPLRNALEVYLTRRADVVAGADLSAAAAPRPAPEAARPTFDSPREPSNEPSPMPEQPSDLPPGVHIDTTDLPGMEPAPAPTPTAPAPTATDEPKPAPAPTPTQDAPAAPPHVDTTDLPGLAPSP